VSQTSLRDIGQHPFNIYIYIYIYMWEGTHSRANIDHKKSTGKMAKALAEFKFRRLRKHFYGTKRL
jgi:hypothetical protein